MAEETSNKEAKTIHILITQCLQNGFFLSDSNRLALPREVVKLLFLGTHTAQEEVPIAKPNRRSFHPDDLQAGPLYKFLSTTIDKPNRNSELHVIHIKDWHTLSTRYDEERRLYGGHCEADTWEAEPIDGFERYLEPWGSSEKRLKQARSLQGYKKSVEEGKKSKVTFYEVLSDSVFDFKRSKTLEAIIPNPTEGNENIELQEYPKNSNLNESHLGMLLDKIIGDADHVYMVMIGVYTDIKIKTLAMGIRSRYDIDNLIVSDVLTASPSLERHLQGLDFMDKVLNVEIVSDLNTLVSVLDVEKRNKGESSEEGQIPNTLTENSIRWRDYRHYFLDKQTVLGYQDQRLAQYLKLTTERSRKIYETLYNTNLFLTRVGQIAISLLLLFIVWNGILVNFPPLMERIALGTIPIELFVVTGIGTFAQIIPLFFTGPQERMQKNLMMLVRLQNYLESYSLTSAILRHHFTTPERLANDNMNELITQISLIGQAAEGLQENFKDISLRYSEQAEPSASAASPSSSPNSAG